MVMRGEKAIPPSKHQELNQEVKRLKKLIEIFPENREIEVLELKTQFLEAKYRVRPHLVAEKIIQHSIQILNMVEDSNNYSSTA